MTDRELKDLIADNFKAIKELRKSQRETHEQMKRTDQRIAELGRRFGDFGNNRGEEVENFFFRYFESEPRLGGVSFDEVLRNVGWSGGEHDIVLINDRVSALISVKCKLREKDVDSLIGREAERFGRLLRKLGSAHSFHAGVAAFILDKKLEDYAVGNGLWVVTRSGTNSVVLNDPVFQARRFG